MLYTIHTLCKPREDIYFQEKVHLAGPKLFCRHSMSISAVTRTTVGCSSTSRPATNIKVGQATFKVKEIKQETQDVIYARDPVRTKRMIQSKYWEENKYIMSESLCLLKGSTEWKNNLRPRNHCSSVYRNLPPVVIPLTSQIPAFPLGYGVQVSP